MAKSTAQKNIDNAKGITGLRTAKPADKRGPKAGSAMSNQSAREVPAKKINPDVISDIAGQRSGPPSRIIETKKPDGTLGKCVVIPQHAFVGELTKLAVVGGSLKAVEAYIATHKPNAKLANGITSRDAPNASKAVADQRSNKAAPASAAKATSTKAAPKAKADSGLPDASAKLTVVAANPKKSGTSTYTRYAAAYKVGRTLADVLKNTTTADVKWDMARGFIRF